MNTTLPIANVTNDNINSSWPIRYIAITGTSSRSCKRLKSLLKRTNYYCLTDCYKNSNELAMKEAFYLPDFVIMEVRSLYSMFSISKRIETLKGAFPGIRLIMYYNMLRRYPLLELKHRQYPELHITENEQEQVLRLNSILKGQA